MPYISLSFCLLCMWLAKTETTKSKNGYVSFWLFMFLEGHCPFSAFKTSPTLNGKHLSELSAPPLIQSKMKHAHTSLNSQACGTTTIQGSGGSKNSSCLCHAYSLFSCSIAPSDFTYKTWIQE